MKTIQIKSGNNLKAMILPITLFFLVSCGSAPNNNEENQDRKVSVREKETRTPSMDIHTATVLGDLKIIQQHFDAGSDLNEREPTVGSTPLISAAVFGMTEVARALIEAGADVNIQNNEGSTALHTAAFLCRTEIVEMLLANGANKDLLNIYGSTPLASVEGPFEQVKPIYDEFSRNLGPLGFRLDYEQLERTRPVIADMLK
jgi:ankyrin repeat protein